MQDGSEGARRFVESVDIPAPRGPSRGVEETVAATLETGKNQAAVVGSDVISFVSGVTAERRESIINSSLLAQLVASKKVPDREKVYDWYAEYFNVLTNIGWVVQDTNFAEYEERGDAFDTHKAIMSVVSVLLGPAPAALALVTTTLNALQSINEDQPWIALFNRESRSAKTARFQVSLVQEEAAGQFFVTLMAFGLEAKAITTQVLFFRAKKQEATLRHYSGKVTINTTVLDAVSDSLRKKLAGHALNFVATLPDL